MPVQTRTVIEGNCPGGQETNSASATFNNNPKKIHIRLTSTEWAAKAGTGTLRWGVKRSPDNTVWEEWASNTTAIGDLDRSGGLPSIAFSGGDMINLVGYRVRLFAEPTVSIRLGAVVTITT